MTAFNMKKAAHWYAKHGWYVVPLHQPIFDDNGDCTGCTCEAWKRENVDPEYTCEKSRGKHPRMNDWENRATIDHEQIEKWWSAWPSANIGIAAGKSGLIVLDSDNYRTAAPLPASQTETITNMSGGGGEHLIYLHPADTPQLGNSKKGLPAYIDVRGWGGQFVAPPSMHPSGTRYEWETGYGPHEIAPAPLPDDIKIPLIEAANQIAERVKLEGLEPVNPLDLDLPNWAQALLSGDRSRLDSCVATALVAAGATDEQIYYLFSEHPPTDKFSGKNGSARQYLELTISKARAYIKPKKEYKPIEDQI